jgi:hypothetical protein
LIELYAATNNLSRNKQENGLKVLCGLAITSGLALSVHASPLIYSGSHANVGRFLLPGLFNRIGFRPICRACN